jgi:hypothetical protein
VLVKRISYPGEKIREKVKRKKKSRRKKRKGELKKDKETRETESNKR